MCTLREIYKMGIINTMSYVTKEFYNKSAEGGKVKVRICELAKEPGSIMVNISFPKPGRKAHRKFTGVLFEEVVSWALNTLPETVCKNSIKKHKFSITQLTDIDNMC